MLSPPTPLRVGVGTGHGQTRPVRVTRRLTPASPSGCLDTGAGGSRSALPWAPGVHVAAREQTLLWGAWPRGWSTGRCAKGTSWAVGSRVSVGLLQFSAQRSASCEPGPLQAVTPARPGLVSSHHVPVNPHAAFAGGSHFPIEIRNSSSDSHLPEISGQKVRHELCPTMSWGHQQPPGPSLSTQGRVSRAHVESAEHVRPCCDLSMATEPPWGWAHPSEGL